MYNLGDGVDTIAFFVAFFVYSCIIRIGKIIKYGVDFIWKNKINLFIQ